MANKYKAESRQAQRRRAVVSQCWRKRPYLTEALAECKGVNVYKCPHCGKFHRASKPGYRKILPTPAPKGKR